MKIKIGNPLKLIFTLFFLFIFFCSISYAEGESPLNPIKFSGEETISINISEGGEEVWAACFFLPAKVSHITFQTVGDYDTDIYLYKNKEDAMNDKYLLYDDDSGDDSNALVTQQLGYPSPYFLKVKMYSDSEVGEFELQPSLFYEDCEECTDYEVCATEAAVKSQNEASSILSTMRAIKKDLLSKNDIGQKIIELYRDISKDIMGNILLNTEFRSEFYYYAKNLLPLLEAIHNACQYADSNYILDENTINDVVNFKNFIINALSLKNAEHFELAYNNLRLKENTGKSVQSILEQSGYLSNIELENISSIPVPEHEQYKYEIFVKVKKSNPTIQFDNRGIAQINVESIDRLFLNYDVQVCEPLFSNIKNTNSESGLNRIFKIRLAPNVDIEQFLQEISVSDDIEYIERNKKIKIFNDIYFPLQWGLRNTDNRGADICILPAWRIETGNPEILVSIIDTGIDYFQADLLDKVNLSLSYDYVNDDNDPIDDHGHGSHVAGVIAGTYRNLYSIAGVAPGISLISMKILDADGSGEEDDLAQALVDSADAGAKIINMSLGGDQSSELVEDALVYVYESGCLAIAAAGNDGNNVVSFPASSDYTVAVGATDSENNLASFSNFGEDLDIVAPGQNIVSMFKNGTICYASGTSMATPFVSGVAALILSKNNTIDVTSLKENIFNGAVDLGETGFDSEFGWGLVNAFNSLKNVDEVN